MVATEFKQPKQRVLIIDYLKGLAIILVVWGHVIQYAPHDGYDFFLNPLYIFIYTFHMPLFIFISGYLFLSSLKDKSFWDILKNKILQLIVPLVIWSFLYYLFRFILGFYDLTNLKPIEIVGLLFYRYITSFPYELWYLWAVFFCSILIAICKIYFKEKLYSYIIIFVLLLLIPDMYNLHMLKFTFPYFALGYLYNKEKDRFHKHMNFVKVFSFIMFPLLIFYWNKDYYIYTTGMDLYVQDIANKVFIIAYRYLTGIVGIVCVWQIIKWSLKYIKLNFIINLGKETLGIYIVSSNLIMLLINKITLNIDNLNIYNFIYTPILSVLVILMCIIIIKLIRKSRYLNRVLLGGR